MPIFTVIAFFVPLPKHATAISSDSVGPREPVTVPVVHGLVGGVVGAGEAVAERSELDGGATRHVEPTRNPCTSGAVGEGRPDGLVDVDAGALGTHREGIYIPRI